jgi:hypothetical protein
VQCCHCSHCALSLSLSIVLCLWCALHVFIQVCFTSFFCFLFALWCLVFFYVCKVFILFFAPLVACFSMSSWFFHRITLSSSSYALSTQHFFILYFVYWNGLFIITSFFSSYASSKLCQRSIFSSCALFIGINSFFSSSLWFAKSSTIVFFEQHCQLRRSTSFHH